MLPLLRLHWPSPSPLGGSAIDMEIAAATQLKPPADITSTGGVTPSPAIAGTATNASAAAAGDL